MIAAIFDPVHIPGTFNFPDTYEHAKKRKNQLNSFIHSWDTAEPLWP